MQIPAVKVYEKPGSGQYHAVLADIEDLGMVTSTYEGKPKTFKAVRFIWILDTNNKEGQPFQVRTRFNVTSLHEKSNIYKALKMILSAPPAPNFEIDSLIGQTRFLWLQKEVKPDGKEFANIMGYLPAQVNPATGQPVVVPVPADFVQARFRPQTVTQQSGRPVQTFQQPPQQQQAQPSQPNAAPSQPNAVPAAFANQGATVKF